MSVTSHCRWQPVDLERPQDWIDHPDMPESPAEVDLHLLDAIAGLYCGREPFEEPIRRDRAFSSSGIYDVDYSISVDQVTVRLMSELESAKVSPGPLIAGALVWPLTHVVFQLLGRWTSLSAWAVVVIGNLLYWSLLLVLIVAFLSRQELALIFQRPPLNNRRDRLMSAISLACAAPPLVIIFVAKAPSLLMAGWALLVFMALCNGLLEEAFWRGVFIRRYGDDLKRAYLLPTLFFSLWHLTLAASPGMHYHGGWPALVGGAAGFGLLWGYTAWTQRSIFFTATGHVLVNLFAFSGLIVDNWPV